ncbi:MAG TPA: DoxX protein [Blastocatellia bacterium]|nr:DoxX protein [Blastocatellia bacterium]
MQISTSSMTSYLTLFLRLALAASYLSSVTSRFGLWGQEMGWGNYANFLDYTAKVNPFLPGSAIPAVGRIVDIAEIAIAVLLIVGFRIRETAVLSGVMLFLFAFGMNLGVGVISTLDHSVYTASAASFLLAVHHRSFLSLDAFISERWPASAAEVSAEERVAAFKIEATR